MSVIRSVSPQTPTDVVAEVTSVDAAEVAVAARRAREAQGLWWSAGAAARKTALSQSADRLRSRADRAAELLVREVGKPLTEARGEVVRSAAILDYYAELSFEPVGQAYPPSAGGLLWSERRPRGVAGLITPWNFPLAIPLWKAAPALTCGNAVLLKPSPDAVAGALLLAELFDGLLPDGLFTVLPGDAETGSAIVASADVVSFTGSAAVGRLVASAAVAAGTVVQCEMGGQNAAIVLPDADAATAAAQVAGAAMGFAGQKCTATRRIIVVGDQARVREVSDAVVAAVESLGFGDPGLAGTAVGPVISAASQQRVLDAVAVAAALPDAQVLTGGTAVGGDGYFVRPAVLTGLAADHPLSCEETFGPLLSILSASSLEAAIAMANFVPFGLVTSIHGRDVNDLLKAVALVDTGMIRVNAPTTGVDFYAPFGGEKDSSFGMREQGTAALQFYSSTRTVTFSPHP